MDKKTLYRRVGTYLLLTWTLSSIFYALILHTGKLGSGRGLYVTGLMWCPGISALLTCLIQKIDIRSLGWRWNSTRAQIWSYLIPLFYSLASYLIIWIAGWGMFYDRDVAKTLQESFGFTGLPMVLSLFISVLFIAIYGLPGSMAHALGEEIGWRGFLTPTLYPHFGFTKTSIITGLIWSIWHYPILIFGDYNSGTPAWYGLSCFTVMVIAMTFIYTWYRIKSGSLWTGVILHASHNLIIQAILTPLTKDTGNTKYFVDEFGIVLPLVAVVVAIYFWTRRNELMIDPDAGIA